MSCRRHHALPPLPREGCTTPVVSGAVNAVGACSLAIAGFLPPHLQKVALAAAPAEAPRRGPPRFQPTMLNTGGGATAGGLEVMPVLDGDLLQHRRREHVDADLRPHEVPHVGEGQLVPGIKRLQLVEQQAGEEVAPPPVPPENDRRVRDI